MAAAPQTRRLSTGVIAGSIAGLVGGLAMIPFFILGAFVSNAPLMAGFEAIGFVFGADAGSAVMLGIVMHLAASVLIGILFGIATAAVPWLRITSQRRGTAFGLITGMIAFAALFMPMNFPSIPQAGLTTQQGAFLMIGIAEHLVYGAVLGAVTARLVLNAGKRRTEGFFECSTCRARFTSAQDLDQHIRVAHHGVAA